MVKGTVMLPVDIGKVTLLQKFYILEHMTKSVILGLDFLTDQNANISLTNPATLTLQKGMTVVPIISEVGVPKTKLVRLVANVSVPAKSELLVQVHTTPSAKHSDVGIIESNPCLPSQSNVMGARCVVEIEKNRTVYKILNPTNVPVQLKRNQIVGKFTHLEKDDILDIDLENTPSTSVNQLSEEISDQEEEYIQKAKDLGIDLSLSELTEDQKRRLLILIGQHRDVFAKDMSELGMCTEGDYTHRIETGNAPPIQQRYYRASPQQKAEIAKKIEEMLAAGVVEPANTTWLSPVILVKKKDGEMRFCVDYRALNKVTHPIQFPLPRLEEVFDSIAESKAKIFTTLDLLSGYFQIPLDPETKHKTGFISHKGIFQFKRLPFGVTNGPASFQMVMTEVLRDMMWQFALVYVDDVLIFSRNFEEHLQHLRAVFLKLRHANLRLKPTKCHFAAHQVHYLGHILSKDGIMVNPEKTEAVQTFPQPKNVKEVRAFLGLCNYYRKFVKHFSHRAAPLNQLLKKDVKFKWTKECEDAFNDLKEALVSPPILSFPDFNKEFILYTDASDQAVGYILGQLDENGKEVVISYGGRALHGYEENWDITEKECLALIEGVKQNHVYLAGNKFKIYTDNVAVSYIDQMKCKKGRLLRWAMFLQQYKFTIHYKPGKNHGNADALSRRPYLPTHMEEATTHPEVEIMPVLTDTQTKSSAATVTKMADAENAYINLHPLTAVQEVLTVSTQDIRDSQIKDPQLTPIIKFLEEDILPEDKKQASRIRDEQLSYQMTDGILYHLYSPRGKGTKASREIKQLCVPSNMRDDILRSYHDSLGHQGQDRTQRVIALKYFWPRMQSDIEYYVKSCSVCQEIKQPHHKKQAPLRPLPIGEVFSRIHMDFIGPLPKTPEGYSSILLVVCAFTKWCEAFPVKSQTAEEVAKVLYSEIICRYGAPRELLTDNARSLDGKLVSEICKQFEITKLRTSSYHPQTNAACERMNSVIEQTLRAYIKEDQSDWANLLPSVLRAYRMTPATESTGFSPFYMLFLRDPVQPIDTELLPPSNISRNIEEHLASLKTKATLTWQIAKDNIAAAQEKYSYQHDKKAAQPVFNVQDRVWLYCSKTKPGLSPKLCKKWKGPFYIAIDYGNHTYKLFRESDDKPVRSVVHANRLKPCIDSETRPTNIPDIQDEEYNPEEITDEDIGENEETVTSQPRPSTSNETSNTDDKDKSTTEQRNQNDTTSPTQSTSIAKRQERKLQPYKIPKEDIKRIKKCSRSGEDCMYEIQFHDKTRRPEWHYKEQVPRDITQAFHVKYTNKGKARKRPVRK